MTTHNPSPVIADRVSVRTYLLAGFSVLGAGLIVASPVSPVQSDRHAALTSLAASTVTRPTAVAPADPVPSAVLGTDGAAAVVGAAARPVELLAPAGPGLQLSLLTGSPNLGIDNVGVFNTGIANTGVANTGVVNDGNFNIGGYNTGDFNIGVSNSGDFNVGVSNDGDFNVGAFNTGERNFGIGNSGTLNVGLANTGVANIGIGNNGTGNIGFFNTGDYTIGAFNIGIRYATGPAVPASTTTVSATGMAEEPAVSVRTVTTRRVSTEDGNKVEPGDVARDTEQASDKKADANTTAEDASQREGNTEGAKGNSSGTNASGSGDDRGSSTKDEESGREQDADGAGE